MDLPESVRKDLPTLTIGGAMYSETASQRMLIINSQVLHEGDKISNDLTLESIQLKSAIFRFRTYRYVVNY
jgi:general secretion pathway protein B